MFGIEKIGDLAGLAKPLKKLIEIVEAGFGKVYEPTHVRRMARAQVDAALIKAEGDLEIEAIRERARLRLEHREIFRQENIDSIVTQAAGLLPESVSDTPVERDWIAEFFNCAQDISDEQMKVLWAKLLAGEVTKPGQFSLRTLNFVKTLSKWEADIFTSFCSFVWRLETDDYRNGSVLGYISTPETNRTISVVTGGLVHLENIGLTSAETIYGFERKEPVRLVYHGQRFSLTALPDYILPKIEVSVVPLTLIGKELEPLTGSAPEDLYIFNLMNSIGAGHIGPSRVKVQRLELVPELEVRDKT
jgi:hypothetical protein